MQYGCTPAFRVSYSGRNEILAFLLANKADINAASKVQQFKIVKILITD
jgi:hypothetical protein